MLLHQYSYTGILLFMYVRVSRSLVLSTMQAPPSGATPPTTVRSPPIQTTRQTGGDDFKYMNEFSDEDFQGSGG